MSVLTSRFARALAVAAAVAALASAPVAIADPSDLVPICSGNQTPENDNCSTGCDEGAPVDNAYHGVCTEPGTQNIDGGPIDQLPQDNPGTDPNVPLGPQ
jgi:hypothetical protein